MAALGKQLGNLNEINKHPYFLSPMVNSANQFVVCKGTSGMGNRILAACTALLYGEIVGRQVVIDWRDQSYAEPGENAFPKFFNCPAALPVEDLPQTDSVFPKVWNGNLQTSLGQLQQDLNLKTYADMSFNPAKADYAEDIIVFCSYTHKTAALSHLFEGEYAYLKSMKVPEILRTTLDAKLPLVKEINDAIYGFKDQYFGDKTIGVHVRYTDIKIPLERVIAKVQKVSKRQHNPLIFLATDSQEVVQKFQAQFPRLVTTNKWFPPDGQRLHQNWEHCPNRYQNGVEALTDLYLLSECDRLIFSSKSSFGFVASLLSKADPHNIFDVEVDDSFMGKIARKSKQLLGTVSSKKSARSVQQ